MKKLSSIKMIIAAVFGVVVWAGGQEAYSQCLPDGQFVVSRGEVKMPVGAFLLVRKNTEIGAIRLISIDPQATEYLGKSMWESYYRPNRSGSFLDQGTIKHAGDIDLRPVKGNHDFFLYGGGHGETLIGKWKFIFNKPTTMPMTNMLFWSGAMSDHGFEFAPTSACNINEVDAYDKRLRWFKYEQIDRYTLPLADLPK